MAYYETKSWCVLHLVLLAACYMQNCVHGELTHVPCLFIFGDSLSDSGNNNNLRTTAKPNYKPYGIDFPKGPTGRFTNGRTTIDIIGQQLGFKKFIPPFANTIGSDIFKGVNYASGAAGIRKETGKRNLVLHGANIALGSQIKNHKTIISRIATKLGGLPQAKHYLNKCLYYINIGSNDYINNYYQPQHYSTSHIYNSEQYAQVLINQLSLYIEALHNVGARKLVLVGLGQIGCTPHAIATNGINGLCAQKQNNDALIFSHKLRSLVDKFNIQHLDSKSIFINSTAGTLDSSLGFKVANAPCCPVRSDGMCVRDSTPCMNRNEYIFYDGFHPTSAVNNLTALSLYDSASNPETTYPMDIKRLVQHTIV
ncbi:GDSL esterase/lipase At1g29670-like isoform X1 [Trifolium pratense]|nr:GDSL esterase/lipase At1g29670-like isoform X1 [Trifolium pratense]